MSRSGFVALAGRPNAGKSTLVNQIVGGKVAIVSDKPQTTRREIRGVATGDDWQLVLVDLPGVQRPRDALTERMQRQVERTLADADAALFVLNGEQEIGPGDRFIADALKRAGVPTVTVLNKVDRLDTPRTVKALSAAAELDVQGELFPISAINGAGVGPVVEQLVSLVPEGPFLYPPDETSDQSLELRLAELVREQVLLRTREEVPHSVEVEIDEIEVRENDGLMVVRARVWAETESQKGILVGSGGRMVRAVGTAARKEIESLLERRVHLELTVRVRKGWRRDEGLLDRLGHRVIERIHAFMRRAEEGVCDEVVRTAHGTALLTPSLPLVWQVNAIRVEDPEAGAEELVDEADQVQSRFGHRKLVMHDQQLGARLAPQLAAAGWNVFRVLIMVRRRPPDRPPVPGAAAEVSRDLGAAALAAFRREQPFGWQAEAVRQLAEMDDRYTRVVGARDFASPPDDPACACRLYTHDGLGQVDEVGTLEARRRRGHARAAVAAAADAAAADGCAQVFMVTDSADWPQELYRRLGFDEIGATYEFLKLPISSRP